jgi:molybdopterin biosynthesis enzyme
MVAQIEMAQHIARLTPLVDVLARIDAAVAPVSARPATPAEALGHILAADIVAAATKPDAALALRDGFAVSSEATTDASTYTPAALNAMLMRRDVGEELPAGSDAVAPLDAVAIQGTHAEILAPVAPGDGVLAAGADVAAGTILRRAGGRLRASDIVVLTAAGVTQVSIRTPQVRIVPTRAGDSVIAATAGLIAHAVEALGALAVVSAGKPGDLEAAFADDKSDAVIAIGGTGTGRSDASVRALARMGRVECHGIGLAPGETAAFGLVGARPVLLLPGRIDSALAVFLVIGRRVLARLAGSGDEETGMIMTLARKVSSTVGIAEVVPVRRRDGMAEPLATGYLPLRALAQADGWILVPPDSEGYPAGSSVMVRAWP